MFVVQASSYLLARRIALATGGTRVPGAVKPDGTHKATMRVEVGDDFEAVRERVENVTVLFRVFEVTDAGEREVASGWKVTAAQFEVEWPDDPARACLVRSHFGARRKAFNCALAQVKADMDARKGDGGHASVQWSLPALRAWWNANKDDLAPWWQDNSKEAYACGIADLVTALENWKSSNNGTRKGAKVGFPRFKSKRKDRGRVRFTTGAMYFTPDRRHVNLPVIGRLATKENTRRVERYLREGRARIFSMTLSERWGRLFVSVNYAQRVTHHAPAPKRQQARAGMDVGMRTLATVSALDTTTGQTWYTRFPAIKALDATLTQRRAAGRKMSRRIRGTRGHLAAKAEVARLDRTCVNLRKEATHQITHWLVSTFGQVVIEDLDLAAMKKSMGRKAFRRHVSDAAMGAFRRLLTYKAPRSGCELVIADRWFASSGRHHGCTDADGNQCWLIARHKMDKMLLCPVTGELVDRDDNAADNLRDWPDLPVDAQLERRPRSSARPETPQPGDGGLDHAPKRGRRSGRKTKRTPRGPSMVRSEPTPDTRQRNSERSAMR